MECPLCLTHVFVNHKNKKHEKQKTRQKQKDEIFLVLYIAIFSISLSPAFYITTSLFSANPLKINNKNKQ